MDDNLYPTSGAYLPTEPTEQAAARKKEASETQKAAPIIQAIIDRFNERIEFYSSIDSVNDEVLVDPEAFMHIVTANKLTKGILQAEVDHLENLIAEHLK